MRIIYLGTPDFAVKPLEAILGGHEVVCVVTQPDRVNARGNKIQFSAVKTLALQKGLNVFQPEKIRNNIDELKKFNADIMVTCAFGQILTQEVIDITPHGVINIHASLLPKYRGSSPVQHALINGEKEIGVTIMQTELSLDTGAIILQKGIELTGNENSAEALTLLSDLGSELVVEALEKIENGTAEFIKQEASQATYYPMLKKEDGILDFNKTAIEVKNFIRGVTPWPSAYCETQNGKLKVLKAEVADFNEISDEVSLLEYENASAGTVLVASPKKGLYVKCIDGCLKLLEIQGENAKAMDAAVYLRGKQIERNTLLCR